MEWEYIGEIVVSTISAPSSGVSVTGLLNNQKKPLYVKVINGMRFYAIEHEEVKYAVVTQKEKFNFQDGIMMDSRVNINNSLSFYFALCEANSY